MSCPVIAAMQEGLQLSLYPSVALCLVSEVYVLPRTVVVLTFRLLNIICKKYEIS